MKKMLTLFIFTLVSGCATFLSTYAPTEEELKIADYGEKPTGYKKIITKTVKEVLIDPESSRFSNFSIPKKDWLSEFVGFGAKKYFGWLVCVEVNAKNRYGGYTGGKPYFFIMQGDNIIFSQNRVSKDISYSWKFPVECKYE